jgi:hypothetical protein
MNIIVVPADVVPALYSGLQLDLWQRVLPELDELLERPGRTEHPEWFAEPLLRLDRARALLQAIDQSRIDPPAALALDLDVHRLALVAALHVELRAHRYMAEAETGVEGDDELREQSKRAVLAIEAFLGGLPAEEARASDMDAQAGCCTDSGRIERAVVLQLLRDDHADRWGRAELERELYDVEPLAIGDALERLKAESVVYLEGEQVWVHPAVRYVDALGLVSI